MKLCHSHLTAAILAAVVCLGALVSRPAAGQALPGDSTPDFRFAVFGSAGGLEDRSIPDDFQNKVLILYYYTPW